MLPLIFTMFLLFFFFFQAEDGIRDTSVTGVQTCALPISRASPLDKVYIRTSDQRKQLDVGECESTPDKRASLTEQFAGEIGRASCRERVEMSGGAVALEKKENRCGG